MDFEFSPEMRWSVEVAVIMLVYVPVFVPLIRTDLVLLCGAVTPLKDGSAHRWIQIFWLHFCTMHKEKLSVFSYIIVSLLQGCLYFLHSTKCCLVLVGLMLDHISGE